MRIEPDPQTVPGGWVLHKKTFGRRRAFAGARGEPSPAEATKGNQHDGFGILAQCGFVGVRLILKLRAKEDNFGEKKSDRNVLLTIM